MVAPCAPIGHTSWASMHFVHMGTLSGTHFSVPLRKLLPLRGRHVCMWWQACRHPYFARFHFVNYCPFGAGMQVPIFRSVPLRDLFLFFAGSFGPSNGHPIGHPCGHPYGAPTFQKINCDVLHMWGTHVPICRPSAPIGTSHCERLPTVK